MQRNEITRAHADEYAKAKGLTILGEINDGVVVKLKNGSISNVMSAEITNYFNARQQVPSKGKSGNLHSASFDQVDNILGDQVSEQLYSMGIGNDVKGYQDLSDQQKVNAMSAGVDANKLTQLLTSRNTINHKRAQEKYARENQPAKTDSGTYQDNRITPEQKEAQLRASHGLAKKSVAANIDRKVSQPINASSY